MFKCLLRTRDDEEEGEAVPGGGEALKPRRAPAGELPGTGARRERTALFLCMRAASSPTGDPRLRSCPSRPSRQSEAERASAALQRIYEEASQARASLASKLAQHSGMMQFSADFCNRAPPLELRMLLPNLEESIEQLLERLQTLSDTLRILVLPQVGHAAELRAALQASFAASCAEARATFDRQRQELRKLAALSPLYSPVSPVVVEKLAAAMGSRSSRSSPSSTTASPQLPYAWSTPPSCDAALLPPLELTEDDDALSEVGDADGEASSRPFSSLFAVDMVTEELPAVPRR